MSDGVPEDLMSIYSEGDRDVDMADVGGSSWARRGMVRRRLQRASALRRSKALSPSMACIPFHPYDRRDRDCHHAASMEDESFNCVPKFVKRAPVIAPSVARVRDTSFQHQAAMYSFGQALEELQLQCQPMTYEQSVWKASEIFTLPPQHRLSHSRSTEERKAHPHAYNPYDMRGRHDWRKREMKKAGQLFPFLAMVSENTTPEPEVCLDPLAELMEGLPIGEEALQTVPSFKDATGTVSDRDAVLFILDAIDSVLHQD